MSNEFVLKENEEIYLSAMIGISRVVKACLPKGLSLGAKER